VVTPVEGAFLLGVPNIIAVQSSETGLRWLRERRIEGIVFLGNTIMDFGFDSVEWTRQWIRQVRDTRL
jgi:hypothetical protein